MCAIFFHECWNLQLTPRSFSYQFSLYVFRDCANRQLRQNSRKISEVACLYPSITYLPSFHSSYLFDLIFKRIHYFIWLLSSINSIEIQNSVLYVCIICVRMHVQVCTNVCIGMSMSISISISVHTMACWCVIETIMVFSCHT